MTWSHAKKEYYAKYNLEWRKRNPLTRENWARRSLPFHRYRAIAKGVAFTITADDIVVPDFCPVFGVRLVFNGGKNNPLSPSLDRVYPKLGYVPGNVAVISYRANMLKGDASASELRRVAEWLEQQQC